MIDSVIVGGTIDTYDTHFNTIETEQILIWNFPRILLCIGNPIIFYQTIYTRGKANPFANQFPMLFCLPDLPAYFISQSEISIFVLLPLLEPGKLRR